MILYIAMVFFEAKRGMSKTAIPPVMILFIVTIVVVKIMVSVDISHL